MNSNIASLKGQRSLANATTALNATAERLSSGQRITKASDDAAGLAIADRLRTDARLYNTARRNLNDGISVLSIMNGALEQQSGILMRLAELAEQSANGSVSSKQRETLDKEYQALIRESGRIGDTTTFNGLGLLRQGRAGEIEQILIQAGITGAGNSRLSLKGGDTGSLSGVFDLSKNGGSLTEFLDIDGDGTPITVSDLDPISTERLSALFNGNVAITEGRIESGAGRGASQRVALGLYIDNDFGGGPTLVTFYETSADSGTWLMSQESYNSVYSQLQGDAAPSSDATISIGADGRVTNRTSVTITGQGGGARSLSIDISGILFLDSTTTGTQSDLLETTRITSAADARSALDLVSRRLSNLSSQRGSIGAFESRINTALSLTSVFGENSAAAEGRIRDADIASESANYARLAILQQVGASLLGQANQQPQLALQLLR